MRKDQGFTLIELMVVVLIIAILIAIAIPTFLGARKRAQDAQAESHLRAALVGERVYYTDATQFTDSHTEMKNVETALAWGDVEAINRGVVIEDASSNGQGVVLKSLSRSGTMFCIADLLSDFDYAPEGYTISGVGTYYAKVESADTLSTCNGVVWEVTSSGWS
jgi:type IV pilus assembly protein PilA